MPAETLTGERLFVRTLSNSERAECWLRQRYKGFIREPYSELPRSIVPRLQSALSL